MWDMVIGVGGGYVRVWRPGSGLASELPAAVVVDSEGELVALGEEAAGREGKLSGAESFLRPFFADRIIQRQALRELVRLALDQAQLSPWERWQATLLLPPTVAPLHADWLERTVREAGVGLVRRRDPLAGLVKNQTRRVKGVPVMGVLDWGFSQLRAAIYAGEEVLAKAAAPHLSVAELCQAVVSAERAAAHRLFPLSALYGLQWGVTHAAYDEAAARPCAGALNPQIVGQVRQAFAAGVLETMVDLSRQLTPEQSAYFRHQGWIVVGGGAVLADEPDAWAEKLGVPVRLATNAAYALLQGSES